MRTVSLPEEAFPATLELNPDLHMIDDEDFDLCLAKSRPLAGAHRGRTNHRYAAGGS
jgi:hypothetical protein